MIFYPLDIFRCNPWTTQSWLSIALQYPHKNTHAKDRQYIDYPIDFTALNESPVDKFVQLLEAIGSMGKRWFYEQ